MMKKYRVLLFAGIWLWVAACNKTGIRDTANIPYPTPDSASDIRVALAVSPYTLFQQAARRVNLDSLLPTGSYFTIFAPVDSAMTSAGLTSDVISTMSLDSLQNIVYYHVAQGRYSAATLVSAVNSIQTLTLRQDLSIDNLTGNISIFQQYLFLKITGSLYINGEAANNPADTALTASNGYIYPIRSVLSAPEQDLWAVLESRPELSMYLTALRLDDSLYRANGAFNGYSPMLSDSMIFNNVVYSNQTASGYENTSVRITMFAPSNAAFASAGFNTPNDLRAYAESGSSIGNDYGVFNFTPLDSVLKQHLIGNGQYYFSNLSLYNDLLYNPDINNGGFNVWYTPLSGQVYRPVFDNQLLPNGSTVNIQWSDSVSRPPAVLPADKGRHFMATNGVVYEIDQLFYPHN